MDRSQGRGYNLLAMESQPGLDVLFTGGEIQAAVKKLAAEIREDYQGRQLLLVGVLKGSFVFLADLVRFLNIPLEIDFVWLSSYSRGRESSGRIEVVLPPRCQVKDRDVLVVEDIVDSGVTSAFLLEYLDKKKSASVRLCALTDKSSRRQVPVKIDYLGFTVPDKFLVGYGLDWDEKFRYLPDICVLEGEG